MGSKKKNSSDSYLTNANVALIAEQMLALEEKNAKRWSKKPAVKRGEDLREILIKNFPGIDENGIGWFAIWVDLYLYVKDLLVCGDEIFALMNVDEAITALQSYESENPEAFEYIVDWAGEFGCLLTEGISSDIGAWFHDWFWDPLDSIGALQFENSLFIENPTLTKLTKLSKSKSVRDRVLVAFHNGTSEDLLTTLSDDENVAVRFAVARNPGTPEVVLDKLVKDIEVPVKKAALANPSISIESLTSIDGDEAKISLASSNKVSSEVLAKLAKEKNEEIRAAVAKNRNTPSEILFALAKDKSDDVRGNVADNPSSSMEIIKILCRDKDYLIRGSIALREDISGEIFDILSKDSDEWVRENVAENREVPEEVLKVLSKDSNSSVRDAALKNSNLADGLIKSFENPVGVKLRLAENASTPIDVLETLSTDGESIYFEGKSTSLMAAVAGNPSITDSLMGKLMKSKNDQVKQALAGNPSLTSNYLDVLVAESRKKIAAGKWDYNNRDLELGLARNQSAPMGYLIELTGHLDSWIVAAVASNPSLPPAQLAVLSDSESLHVRQGVAENPKAPWALLKSLLKEADCFRYLCKNPATRGEELVEIASQSTDAFLLSDIAKHNNTPIKLIEELAKHKEAWVRLGVANNTNTPSAIREKILDGFLNLKFERKEGDEYIARCIFSTDEMFENVFNRYLPLESESRARILGYIATNLKTPAAILTRLATDRFSEIRVAVASNPSTPVEVLRELSK